MTKRLKCPHCGKVADFFHEYCTLCWAHRTKGAVLREDEQEMLALERAAYERSLRQKEWQQKFERWQKLVIGPAVLLTLASIGWSTHLVAPALAGRLPWLWLLFPSGCLIGFALGGYWVGGGLKLTMGASLMAAAGLLYGYATLAAIESELAAPNQEPMNVILSIVEAALCGIILYGSVQIIRLARIKPALGG